MRLTLHYKHSSATNITKWRENDKMITDQNKRDYVANEDDGPRMGRDGRGDTRSVE